MIKRPRAKQNCFAYKVSTAGAQSCAALKTMLCIERNGRCPFYKRRSKGKEEENDESTDIPRDTDCA